MERDEQGIPRIPVTAKHADPRRLRHSVEEVRRYAEAHRMSYGNGLQTVERVELLSGGDLQGHVQ